MSLYTISIPNKYKEEEKRSIPTNHAERRNVLTKNYVQNMKNRKGKLLLENPHYFTFFIVQLQTHSLFYKIIIHHVLYPFSCRVGRIPVPFYEHNRIRR